MKTPWKMLGILLLLNCSFPAVLKAQFNYTINTDLTITITGYTGPGGAVTVPGTIQGLPVTRIADSAFQFSGLKSITIPNSVISMGDFEFSYCGGLTNVT